MDDQATAAISRLIQDAITRSVLAAHIVFGEPDAGFRQAYINLGLLVSGHSR